MTGSVLRSSAPRLALVVVVLVALGPSVWLVRTLGDVPGLIVLTAAVPALLYAYAVVRIDRRDPEPRAVLAAAVFAGAAIAAYLSHTANAWLLSFAATFDAEQARPLAGGFGAPVVEEIAKAATLVLVLVLGRGLLAGTLDGIVYGALVGIGFAFTENVVYLTFAVLQGGSGGLWRAVYVRALLGGWNHAAFTATSGAALGWALGPGRPRGRWLVVAIGLALATLQHVVWNAVAASAIQGVLCGPELAGGPCRPIPSDTSLFLSVPALTAIFMAPGFMTLGAIALLAGRPEKSI
jgi:RsiW-degrading membrane proteinase PrsW (M82 family)